MDHGRESLCRESFFSFVTSVYLTPSHRTVTPVKRKQGVNNRQNTFSIPVSIRDFPSPLPSSIRVNFDVSLDKFRTIGVPSRMTFQGRSQTSGTWVAEGIGIQSE